MHQKTQEYQTLEKQVNYVIDFLYSMCKIDIIGYLKKIFTLDYIILNEDRHFNNLGGIMREVLLYQLGRIG